MGNFADLPDPETIQHRNDAAEALTQALQARHDRLVRDQLEPLFFEMATKLRDHKIKPANGRGWSLGSVANTNDDYPPILVVLLSDGSVSPSISSGIRVLLGSESDHFWKSLASDDPALVSLARGMVIEALNQRYMDSWAQPVGSPSWLAVPRPK